MRRLPLALAVLLLAPLLAASTQAQATESVTFAFAGASASGTAARGSIAYALVEIENARGDPIDVTMYVNNSISRDVHSELDPPQARVAAGARGTMRVIMYVAHDAAQGDKRIQLYGYARGTGNNSTANAYWNADYTLTVLDRDATDLPVVFTPRVSAIAVPESEPGNATFLVRNTGVQPERAFFAWRLSDGYRGATELPRLFLPPSSDVELASQIARESWARDGSARLVAFSEAGTPLGFATVDLRPTSSASPPPQPEPQPAPVPLPIEETYTHDFRGPAQTYSFDVPSGALGFAVGVGFDPHAVYPAENAPNAVLRNPSGALVPGCGAPCNWAVERPAEGTWTLELSGSAAASVEVVSRITATLPLRVVLAPWVLERENMHSWSDPDFDMTFPFNTTTESFVLEVWRPNDTTPDGVVFITEESGVERARCDVGRCFIRLSEPFPDGWRVQMQGPGVGGVLYKFWVLHPASKGPASQPEPPLRNETQLNETVLPPELPPRLPEVRAILEMDPVEVVIRPGEAAQAVLRIRSNSSEPYAVSLVVSMPRGVTASIEGAPATIAPGESAEALVHLRASPSVESNVTLDASIRSAGARGGAFTIRIGEPLPPPDDDLKGDANAPADGGAAASLAPLFAAAAAGVGVSALGVAAARRKWPLAFAALYAKLRPSKVLEHEARRRMTDLARAEPGISVGELQRRLGLANGEIAHHLHVLERARILKSARDGQMRRVYPIEYGRAPTVPELGERALAALRERPRTLSALATDLGVSRQALHYHIKKLVEQRLVEPEPDGTLRAVDAVVVFERV